MSFLRIAILWALTVPAAALARAEPDKTQYDLFDPTPDAQMRGFSSDRPAKGFTPFTVDAGHFQYEMDFLNFSHTVAAGMSTRSFETLDPLFRLGLTNSIDMGLQFGGLRQELSTDRTSGASSYDSGFGDLTLLPRFNLFGNDGGRAALALMPYAKLPTATGHLGNGAGEAGLIAPLVVKLPQDVVMTLVTEVDALKNAVGSGRHANFVDIISVERELPGLKGLIAEIEFYSSVGTDRLTPAVRTLDTSLQYPLTPNLQVDAGANFGLNRDAPRLQLYTGIAQRF